jgi:predicted SnoaL-like aldol condensation-catalyzing enzyme
MQKHQLQSLLDAEVDEWSQKPYSRLLDELSDVAAYQRDGKVGFHQFEVQMVEREPDYVHVIVSIDDGSFFTINVPTFAELYCSSRRPY